MSKVITDENQLNTEVDDLITEDYALEVLSLKNPADFRKFSRSFMKLSKIVKEIDDSNNNKLDKGGYNGTAKNLNDELSKKATKTQLGRIIVGDNLTVDVNGKLNGTPPVDITGKLNKGSVPEKYNTAEKIANELDKKASKTELGRVKIGQNLSITEDGVLNGNPVYTHPTGNGYSHLPINGATGQFIKYASAGNGQWSQITWNDITGKPSTFPTSAHTQDWSTITGKPSSFTPSSHKHTKAEITDFPSSLKNPSALTIQANGTSLGSYDGSTAKTFNITASNVGASPSNHNHDSTYSKTSHTHTAGQVGAYTKGEIDTKFKNYPVPVGGILMMYNTSNPAELYSGTTWELLATDKYLKTTTGTPLSSGGSNSFTIAKANLPNEKLSVDTFQLGKGTQEITGTFSGTGKEQSFGRASGAFAVQQGPYVDGSGVSSANGIGHNFKASRSWSGMSTSASPQTQNMGSGTAITFNPTYITIRAWKRLT